MDLFRAPHLNAKDYLSRISEAASDMLRAYASGSAPDGNQGKGVYANWLNPNERPFFQTKGEPLSAEVLYLKLHLLETLAAELIPQGETLAHPQIPQTLDRVWLRANHQLSHVPYFWRFTLDWLEPAAAPLPTDFPRSGVGYCLNALALIWQSVFEFDENKGRKTRKNSADEVESPESKGEGASRKPISKMGHPTSSWQRKIIQEAMQIGNALSQTARGEISADPVAFLGPIESLKNPLWERIFTPVPHPAPPEAFPAELQAALNRIADRWEEDLAEDSSTPEEPESVEESSPVEEEAISMDDDADGEFITETIVTSAPEDTARLEREEEPKAGREAASEESIPYSEPDDSLAQRVALRKGSTKPEEHEQASSEPVPETAHGKEESLAETVVLKQGGGPRPHFTSRPSETPVPPPDAEPGLAETVVLRGNGPKKNGQSHGPPPPTESPETQDEEADDLAATVIVRPDEKSSAKSETMDAQPTAPENEAESSDSLTETVILRPGRSRGKERP
jgi:hypothetical protein